MTQEIATSSSGVLFSAAAKPMDNWEEKDYESEIQKLESEAEERIEAKIAEMMSKVAATGEATP